MIVSWNPSSLLRVSRGLSLFPASRGRSCPFVLTKENDKRRRYTIKAPLIPLPYKPHWFTIQRQSCNKHLIPLSRQESIYTEFEWSCDIPIFLSSLFSSPIKAAPNSFDPLVNLSNDLLSESLQPTSSEADLGIPRSATKHTSTSRKKSQYLQKLKVLNQNCNSIRSQHKSGFFKAKVEDEKPHIIIATESKLDDSIRNSEVFPSDYEIFRKTGKM